MEMAPSNGLLPLIEELSKELGIEDMDQDQDMTMQMNTSCRSLVEDGADQTTDSQDHEKPLAKNETRAVACSKLIVILVLVLSAVGVAIATYFYLHSSEIKQFESDFQSNAFKVMEAVGKSLEKTLKGMDSLAVNCVSHARATDQSWPFVTMPNFAMQAAKLVSLTDLIFLSLMPKVTVANREAWEAYAVLHDDWANDSIPLLKNYDLYYGPVEFLEEHVPVVWGDFGDIPYNITRDMLPQWENYPPVNDVDYPSYNYDWMSMAVIEAPKTALYKHHAVISAAYLLPDPTDPVDVAETEIWTDWIAGFLAPGMPADEPASDMYFPIYDQVDQIRSPSSALEGQPPYDPANDKYEVVGTLTGTLQWRGLIQNILPEGTDGVILVFENPCNPYFTYQINGPNIQYLGRGDLHDTKYDDQRIRSNIFDLRSFFVGGSSYTGPPMDHEFCPFVLNVYPSDDMKALYETDSPVIFTVVVSMIFVFTTAIFLLYDCLVERRQKLVLNTAERSNAVVASLFPQAVRDQLADAIMKKNNKRGKASAYNLQAFLADHDQDNDKTKNGMGKTPPIASLYPETTVMFADIAGFTQWSSTRSPVHVFTLLETLYGAFDEIAKRRKVFKVETIGDCYVAVTGLPQAQPQHAQIMARFARDCRSKMQELSRELQSELGEDTGTLALRVGLHSGPTTAGVLRGDKSRFQLFGDTVNTAARHEAHGLPNMIQVSQQTADILFAAGKGNWLTMRPDKIQAKGKGELQTYWCEPSASMAGSGASYSGYSGHSGASYSGYSHESSGIGYDVSISEFGEDKGFMDLTTFHAMIDNSPGLVPVARLMQHHPDGDYDQVEC